MDSDLSKDYALWRPPSIAAAQYRLAILLVPQASGGGVATIFEDFAAVNTLKPYDPDRPRFSITLVAASPDRARFISGAPLQPQGDLTETGFDGVILPALYDDGALTHPEQGRLLNDAEIAWLRAEHADGALISTMCSGAYLMGEAGLLDGQRAAMYALYQAPFQARFPKIDVVTNRTLLVSGDHGELVTGGLSIYSADVSLYNIAHFVGPNLAMTFAQLYGRAWSDALHAASLAEDDMTPVPDRIIALAQQFMRAHLADTGLVASAADMANLTPRTFTRRFRKALGVSPQDFLTSARMDRARNLLTTSRMPVEDVAAKVGYADRSSFAKTFRAKTGVTPATYRAQTQGAARLNR